MKSLLLASLLLAQQNGPIWNPEQQEVPFPIPRDMCIEARTTEKGRKAGGDWKIKFYENPQDNEDLFYLEEMRKRGLATLKRCSSADS